MGCCGNISDLKMNSNQQQLNGARALDWRFGQIKSEPRVWSWGGGRGGHRRVSPSAGGLDAARRAGNWLDKIEIEFDIRPPRLKQSRSQAMREKAAIRGFSRHAGFSATGQLARLPSVANPAVLIEKTPSNPII